MVLGAALLGAAADGGAPGSTPGDLGVGLRLGGSMTLLQFSIGALNDIRDRHADARAKPGRPIPAGNVSVGAARVVAATSAGLGLLLAAASGPAVLALSVLVLAIGGLYDLALKGTPWSWLPFAIGIPLLPVYGWLGATGGLSPAFLLLVPVAVAEGAALAMANGLVDVERDRAAGVSSVATALGRRLAGRLVLLLQAAVVTLALISGLRLAFPSVWLLLIAGAGSVVIGGAAVAAPIRATPTLRAAGWAAQAAATTVLGVSWIGGAVASRAA